ncbi:MAG: tetratricopeptide repeat protein [Candidatus Hydrogenedens sp.]
MSQCPFCEKPINENTTQCPHCGAPIKASTIPIQTNTEPKLQGICPNCKSPVNKTDIICIYCGTNLLTGTKILAEPPKDKKNILPSINKKYFLYGLVVIFLLLIVGFGIIYITYDPIASAINLSQTNVLGAIDILQKYIAKNPQSLRAHLVLGKLYLNNNQIDEALTEFDKVITINDKDNDVIWLALLASTKKNDKEQQLKYIKKLIEKYPERNDLKLLNLLGEGNISNITNFEQLFSLSAGSEINKSGIIALLLSQGNYSEVLNLIRDKDISPRTALLLLILSEKMKNEQNRQEYLVTIEKNIQELSDTEKALLACQVLKSGDNNKTLQILQSLKNREKLPSVLNYLYALTLLNSGLTTEAIIELEKIKNSEGNYSNDASLDLALIYFQQDNISKATELIQSIKNKGQQTPRCYLIEGRIALVNNDSTFAQQCFANAIQKDPNYAPAYLENGLLYIQKGVLSEGLKHLKTYIQIVKNTVPNYSTAEIEVLIEQIEQTLVNNPTPSQTNATTQ